MRASLIIPVVLLFSVAPGLQAQKGDPAPEWRHELVIVPNSITYRDTLLPGFSFTVFESDQDQVMELWRADHATRSASITKGDVAIANGAQVAQLTTAPAQVFAQARGDKRSGNTTLAIAVRSTDSISQEKLQAYARDLAVRYNRGVVEAQIAAAEKDLEKARAALGKSASKDNKLKANVQKTNASLNKLQAERTRQQRKNAEIQGDIAGAEQKYAISNDVKDLKKLTKYRSKLAQGETKVAKIMEKEAKLNSTLTKYSGDLPDSAETKEDKARVVAKKEQQIEQLRSKLADIR